MKVVERLRIDYNRFCGGFHFRGYLDTLADETGNNLEMDEDSVLYEWIEETAKNQVDTFLDPE